MKARPWIAALLVAGIVVAPYLIWFIIVRNSGISTDPAEWGSLGDYVGGLLNPVLSFISIVLILKSLELQRQANESISAEQERAQHAESARVFETKFFRLVELLQAEFARFEVVFSKESQTVSLQGSEAVIEIERRVSSFEKAGQSTSIPLFIRACDSDDRIYSCVRRFHVVAKLISKEISNERGFTGEDRKEYFETLVSFLDFPLVRLIYLSMQHTSYKASKALMENQDLQTAFASLGFGAMHGHVGTTK